MNGTQQNRGAATADPSNLCKVLLGDPIRRHPGNLSIRFAGVASDVQPWDGRRNVLTPRLRKAALSAHRGGKEAGRPLSRTAGRSDHATYAGRGPDLSKPSLGRVDAVVRGCAGGA